MTAVKTEHAAGRQSKGGVEHILRIRSDVTGINHVVLFFYCGEIITDKRFPNNPVRWRCNRKVATGGKPGGVVVCEAFQDLSAVTADIADYTLVYKVYVFLPIFIQRDSIPVLFDAGFHFSKNGVNTVHEKQIWDLCRRGELMA